MPTLSSLPDIHMSVEGVAMDSDECKEREKMHPTTEELRLLGEVSSLIGRGEHVHPINAMNSLNAAMNHHSLPSLRSFLNKNSTKIVSIILYALNMGEIDLSQKENIRSCLESVIELVINDLAKACEDDQTCHTLTALSTIFDEAAGYHESDAFRLRNKFRLSGGFAPLGLYLSTKASSRLGNDGETVDKSTFPSFHSLITIMILVSETVGYSHVKSFRNDCVRVARSAMFYLLSLSDEEVIQLADDVVDMRSWANKIYRRMSGNGRNAMVRILDNMTEFLELHRTFALKLIKSSPPLKLLGYSELVTVMESSSKLKPLPMVYFVDGAGMEEVNGKYEFDTDLLCNGILPEHLDCLRYVKKDCCDQENENPNGVNAYDELSICDTSYNGGWTLKRVKYIDYGEPETTSLYYTSQDSEAEFNRPSEDGWSAYRHSIPSPMPTVKPCGFLMTKGVNGTVHHNLVDWIVENNMLEIVANSAKSNHRDLETEAKKALKSMLSCVSDLVHLVKSNISVQISVSDRRSDRVLNDAKRDETIINLTSRYLKDLDVNAKDFIGQDSIANLCDIVDSAHKILKSVLSGESTQDLESSDEGSV